jgi:2-keto-3-deoxy-L-rhamnonate aldolase RhmA
MTRNGPSETPSRKAIRLAGWLAIPEPLIVEVAARSGFDWIGFDLQHGAWDFGSAFRGIQLIDVLGKPVMVRLIDEQLSFIPRVLDHGASGIVLAMASDPDTVAAAIARSRYQPDGMRSYGGQRYGMRPEPKDVAEVRPAIHAMIETRRGLDAIAEIASVSGLAGLHIGPADLSFALGLGKDLSAPVFTDSVAKIVAAGRANGLAVTMHAVSPGQIRHWTAIGIDEFVLTTDIELLRAAFNDLVVSARAALDDVAAAPDARGIQGQASRPG